MPVLSFPVEELSHLCVSVALKPFSEGFSFNLSPMSQEPDNEQKPPASQYSIKFETFEDGDGYVLRIRSVLDRPSPLTNQACNMCREISLVDASTQLKSRNNNDCQTPHIPDFGDNATFLDSDLWAIPSQTPFTFEATASEQATGCDWMPFHSSLLEASSPLQSLVPLDPSRNISTAPCNDMSMPGVEDLPPPLTASNGGSDSTSETSSQWQSPVQSFLDYSVSPATADSSPLNTDTGSRQSSEDPSECDQDRPLKCPQCDRRFRWEHSRRAHTRTHLPKPPKSFPCTMSPSCDQSFSRQHDRLRHEVTKHGRACKWACEGCGKFFSSQRTLDSHVCTTGVPSRWKIPQSVQEQDSR